MSHYECTYCGVYLCLGTCDEGRAHRALLKRLKEAKDTQREVEEVIGFECTCFNT